MIQGKVNGKWGKLPDDTLPELPPNGTIVAFQFLYSYPHPVTKKPTYKVSEGISPIVRVRNPKTKQPMEIGLIGGVDINGNPLPFEIRRISANPQAWGGLWHITIGNSADSDELYQFLMLSSQNEDSPIRDEGIEPVFRNKDYNADAKAEVAAQKARMEVLRKVFSMNATKLDEAALLHGIDVRQDPDMKQAAVAKIAEADPAGFLAKIDDKDADAKATLAKAQAFGVVKVDGANKVLRWSNDAILLEVTQTTPDELSNEWAEYIRADKNGGKVLNSMKSQIDAAMDKQAMEAKKQA